LQSQLIEERKRRIELEEKLRERLSGKGNETLLPPPEQKKRPKNAFVLFLADQRAKMIAEYPTLPFEKIVGVCAIKWKRVSE